MISLAAKSSKRAQDFKHSLAVVTKAFAGKNDVRIGFHKYRTDTDCGKEVVLRDPEYLIETYSLAEQVAEDIATCSAAHEAAHIKFKTNLVKFRHAVFALVDKGADRELAFDCTNLAEDQRVDKLMGDERPGYLSVRKESAPELIRKLYSPLKERNRTLFLLVIARLYGASLSWPVTAKEDARITQAVKLFEQASNASKQEDAYELGAQAYEVLYGLTPKVPTAPAEPKPPAMPMTERDPLAGFGDHSDTTEKEYSDEEEGDADPSAESGAEPKEEDGSDGADHADDSDDSAGDSAGDSADDADKVADVKPAPGAEAYEELDDWMDKKTSELFKGDSLAEGAKDSDVVRKLSADRMLAKGEAELAQLQRKESHREIETEHTALSVEIENAHSKGADAGVQIWYTRRSVIKRWTANRSELLRTRELPAMIADLTGTFSDSLRKARERDTYLHRSGSIRADKVWRGSVLGDGRVFTRHEEKAAGGYAAKLLLDASGSMFSNANKCAVVAYAIAKALHNAGMSLSVEAFDAVGDSCAVVHHPLVPWGSSDIIDVLAYHAKEENRDGFSIKAAGYDLLKRPEPHKILIVLSDGYPAHGGHSQAIRAAGGIPGGAGAGLNAEAARAVRSLRQQGVKVLGVYFGHSASAIEAEIYGKDYVRVSELSEFASAVRTYLTRIMLGGG